jgi:hypothetical protein
VDLMSKASEGHSAAAVFGPTRVDPVAIAELAAALGMNPGSLRSSLRCGAIPEPDDPDTDRPPQRRRPTWSADRARAIVAREHPLTPQQQVRRAAHRVCCWRKDVAIAQQTQQTLERVSRECSTRRMVTGVGTEADGTACLMSAVNRGLTGLLTDGPHACVSEAIRGLVVALHDQLPDAVRSGQAWRSLGPAMVDTGSDGLDGRRVQMVLEWVRESVFLGQSVYGLSDMPIWAGIWDEHDDYGYAGPAAAHAIATAADAADAAEDRQEFWDRVDAPGLVRSLCEIGR